MSRPLTMTEALRLLIQGHCIEAEGMSYFIPVERWTNDEDCPRVIERNRVSVEIVRHMEHERLIQRDGSQWRITNEGRGRYSKLAGIYAKRMSRRRVAQLEQS